MSDSLWSRLRGALPRFDDGGLLEDDVDVFERHGDEVYWDKWDVEEYRVIRDVLVEIEEADDLEEAQNEAKLLREDIEGIIRSLERIHSGEHPWSPSDWGETDE